MVLEKDSGGEALLPWLSRAIGGTFGDCRRRGRACHGVAEGEAGLRHPPPTRHDFALAVRTTTAAWDVGSEGRSAPARLRHPPPTRHDYALAVRTTTVPSWSFLL